MRQTGRRGLGTPSYHLQQGQPRHGRERLRAAEAHGLHGTHGCRQGQAQPCKQQAPSPHSSRRTGGIVVGEDVVHPGVRACKGTGATHVRADSQQRCHPARHPAHPSHKRSACLAQLRPPRMSGLTAMPTAGTSKSGVSRWKYRMKRRSIGWYRICGRWQGGQLRGVGSQAHGHAPAGTAASRQAMQGCRLQPFAPLAAQCGRAAAGSTGARTCNPQRHGMLLVEKSQPGEGSQRGRARQGSGSEAPCTMLVPLLLRSKPSSGRGSAHGQRSG